MGGMALSVRPRPTEHGRTRLALAVLAIILLMLLAVGAGTAAWLHHRLLSGLERFPDPFADLPDRPPAAAAATPAPGSPPPQSTGTPVNLLLLGTDSRTSAGHQWVAGGQRTDAIMLAHVSGDRRSVHVMSIPRDSWVDIPGHGTHKINAAFSFGGPSLAVATIEQLTGVRIDHVAIADFTTFSRITDALGGVELTLTAPLAVGERVLEPGTHRLDGEAARAYTQQRYGLPGGDLTRVQRHQAWLRAVGQSLLSEDVLSSPAAALEVLETVTNGLAVDETFSVTDMAGLAYSLRHLRAGDVTFLTAPVAGLGRSPDGRQSIVELDEARFAAVARAFAQDDVADYLRLNPGAVPTLGETAG